MRRIVLLSILLLVLGLIPLGSAFAQGQGVTVIDDFGREVLIPHEPNRIVSIAPSITETLFALGLGDKVVGVTRYCNYPPEVLERVGKGEITVIGGFIDPSLEKIIELNPDLVIGHNLLNPEFVAKIEDAGIPIIIVKTSETIEGIYDDIRLIGKACWAEEEASKLVEELKYKISYWEKQVEGVERVDVAEIAWVNPLWVAGNGTYINDVIEHAGGRNVFADRSGWASISDEELVEKDPDYLIVPYRHGEELIYDGIMDMKERGLIHGEVIPIDPDIISRPGPRAAILFEEVVKALHPDVWSRVYTVENLIAPKRAIVGDLVTVYVQVKNDGMVSGEKLVELNIDGKTLSKTISLKPGEEKLLNFTFIVEEKGECKVSVKSLSRSIEVSPTSEEIMNELRRSLEEYMKSYIDENISPTLTELKNGISEIDKRMNSLNNLATASIALSAIAIIISLTSLAYVLRVRKT